MIDSKLRLDPPIDDTASLSTTMASPELYEDLEFVLSKGQPKKKSLSWSEKQKI